MDRIARGRLEGVFDRSGGLKRPSVMRLPVEFASFLTYRPQRPDPGNLPDGQGHRVLVIPGLMTVDQVTAPLRGFLRACGYRSVGWAQGINMGPMRRDLEALRRRLVMLNAREDGPVSVVGVSMGGIMARLLAHEHPHLIRRVVTVVSPTHLPTASNVEPLIRALAPLYGHRISAPEYNAPLAMPSLALFTRDDGLIAWESCRGRDDNCTTIEVTGSHTTICRNPQVLQAVAHFLAPDAPADTS